MEEKRKKKRNGPNKRSDLIVLKIIKRLKTRMMYEFENGLIEFNNNTTHWE